MGHLKYKIPDSLHKKIKEIQKALKGKNLTYIIPELLADGVKVWEKKHGAIEIEPEPGQAKK